MLEATIIARPEHFDRVDRVKAAVGEEILAGDERFWILGEPLVVDVDGERIEIPTGFTTDGASVPGWAQRITAATTPSITARAITDSLRSSELGSVRMLSGRLPHLRTYMPRRSWTT
jgi:hypothetical protein